MHSQVSFDVTLGLRSAKSIALLFIMLDLFVFR